jgi:transposase-like protein
MPYIVVMNLQQAHFHNDDAAREYFEKIRWPHGRVCPWCGVIGEEYATKRKGRYRCGVRLCRKDFSTTTGTVMESSKIGLSKWLWTFATMTASKKGVSSQQVRRQLQVSADTAWFMCHRVREAMKAGGLLAPMGGVGKVVEIDETFHGKTSEASGPIYSTKRRRGSTTKQGGRRKIGEKCTIVTLVERGGASRSFHVAHANVHTVGKILRENVAKESRLHTDGSPMYTAVGREYAEHAFVDHSKEEYVRYEETGVVHNNSCESYFSVFKRGMRGVYQHCREKHLHRYLTEFDFRHNTRTRLGVNDEQRADLALVGAEGKRLKYRRSNGEGHVAR